MARGLSIAHDARMRRQLAVALLLVGCSKQGGGGDGDECQRVAEKSLPIIAEMAGKPLGDADKAKVAEKCREAIKDGRRDSAMDCIVKAADTKAVRDCMQAGFGAYKKRSKGIEGKLLLNRLSSSAKRAWVEQATFPVGKVGLTPATPCCQQPDHKCAVNPADWADPTWKALDFAIDEPGRFQFSYESDGKTASATAVGDPECDGKTMTYTLAMKADGGNPTATITEPPE